LQLVNTGVEEYEVCRALRDGTITKPLIAWCIGTCATMFNSEVQFGHAGSCANADRETAVTKNKALAEAGAKVPHSFDDLGDVIHQVNYSIIIFVLRKTKMINSTMAYSERSTRINY